MTVREALAEGTKKLRAHACAGTDARREAEALLMHVTGLRREDFFLSPGKKLATSAARRFNASLARRLRHEPLDYILGSAWFRGHEFAVNRRTLIPRPATESIVDAALAAAKEKNAIAAIDVGTGSGCIAISLALELKGARIFATDASAGALALAKKNAACNGVRRQIRFLRGDLLSPVPARHLRGPLLVVANLPYLPAADLPKLIPDIRRHEPKSALDGGKDGLSPSRALVDQLVRVKKSDIILIFEILAKQYSPLAAYVKKNFPATKISRIKNHQGVTVGLRADI
jgi:release factor glutamine methyltransferase